MQIVLDFHLMEGPLLGTVFVGGTLVSWKSRKNTIVVRSNAKSEHWAMDHTTCELIWLKHMLEELGFGQSHPMNLMCDNQAAIHIASNSLFHEWTNIEIDYHFAWKKLLQNVIWTEFVRSVDQLADLFTKPLGSSIVSYICNKLGTYDMYAPALGGVLSN